MRVRRKVSGSFWTEKGEARIPLSPSLFSISIADVEEELKKGRTGGVQIGKGRILSPMLMTWCYWRKMKRE